MAKRKIEIMKTGFSTVPQSHTASKAISLSLHTSMEELKVVVVVAAVIVVVDDIIVFVAVISVIAVVSVIVTIFC